MLAELVVGASVPSELKASGSAPIALIMDGVAQAGVKIIPEPIYDNFMGNVEIWSKRGISLCRPLTTTVTFS